VADKPEHILEIPDSLGRDVDRFREGKTGKAPDISAFMSDASLQQAWDAQRPGAVRQQDLVPISPAEAARRVTFDGEHLPSVPVQRRVLPAPFRRESFTLDRHGRAWTSCRADAVVPGDVVPDVGRVAVAETVTRYETVAGVSGVAVGMKTILTGVTGNRVAFDPGQLVRAFRLAE
jgi:hypothetical protein